MDYESRLRNCTMGHSLLVQALILFLGKIMSVRMRAVRLCQRLRVRTLTFNPVAERQGFPGSAAGPAASSGGVSPLEGTRGVDAS